ncbi:antitoxin [Nocardioides sp. KIGAM211]|uniref:Antitoxin n=1 Tax=Nocardioides luti TaxID=2761101 RepID=A0A7X0RF82_9ACTN|nr:antitoxin [Nocardioides luti]MBB6627187.1 antitoxin [Nocardioides luti]
MSFFDKAKKAVSGAVDKHGDKIAGGIDKAAAAADKKTGGKHSGQLATGAQKAKEALDKLDGKNDDIRDTRRDERGPR